MKEIVGLFVMAVLLTWAVIDFGSLHAVVSVLFGRFVQLVQAISNAAESAF